MTRIHRLQENQKTNRLPVVKEADCVDQLSYEGSVPMECIVRHDSAHVIITDDTRSKKVLALDVSQSSLLFWHLHDQSTYYVFAKLYDGKYRYMTFNGENSAFTFECNENDPTTINLSGTVSDERVFYFDTRHHLVVASSNCNQACFNAKTYEVYASRTGETWQISS